MENACSYGAVFISGLVVAAFVVGLAVKILLDKYVFVKRDKTGSGGDGSNGGGGDRPVIRPK